MLTVDDPVVHQHPYCIINKQLQLVLAPMVTTLLQFVRLQMHSPGIEVCAVQ